MTLKERIVVALVILSVAATAGIAQQQFSAPVSVGGPNTDSISSSDNKAGLEVVSTSSNPLVIKETAFGDNTELALHFDKAGGSQSSPSSLSSGYPIISIGGRAYDTVNSSFDGSSAAFVCVTKAASYSAYTQAYCTIGTTPSGGGARQDWFYFGDTGNFTAGGTGDPHYSGMHSISVEGGSGGATFELLDSSGTPSATIDLALGNYFLIGSRINLPTEIMANGHVGLTVNTDGSVSISGGVSCSGTPSTNFTVTNGIVTHC